MVPHKIKIVEAEYCRDKEPEPFAFEIDSFGMPHSVEECQVKTTKNDNKLSEVDYDT